MFRGPFSGIQAAINNVLRVWRKRWRAFARYRVTTKALNSQTSRKKVMINKLGAASGTCKLSFAVCGIRLEKYLTIFEAVGVV